MAKKIKVVVFGDQIVSITRGELHAIEAMARQNGTHPEKTQYDPGRVRRDTLRNLWNRGLLSKKDGLYYFPAGMLPVMGPTIYSDNPFTLTRA